MPWGTFLTVLAQLLICAVIVFVILAIVAGVIGAERKSREEKESNVRKTTETLYSKGENDE